MTTTITWKALPVSPALSVTGTTLIGWFNQLNNYFVSLAANADFHWEVCSFSVAANPYHLVLKRKNGLPGRILFMGVTISPNAVYNDSMRNFSWSAPGVRATYFPEATSDVPANLLVNVGDVFTNPAGCPGMSPVYSAYTAADLLKVYSSQEGIVLRSCSPASNPTGFWVVGDLLERYDEIGLPCAGMAPTILTAMAAFPAVSTPGYAARLAGTFVLLGESLSSTIAVQTYLRDLATKHSWYYPVILGTVLAAKEDIVGYKLRQIARGGVPLAANEINYVTGPVEKAFSLAESTNFFLWITNDKV